MGRRLAPQIKALDTRPRLLFMAVSSDSGYVAGALIAGTVADALGYSGAIILVAGLTAASGIWVLIDMPPKSAPARSPRPQPT